ncbi:PIN domain-containing protein [Mucilaginibacter sp. 10B2]|uniref:PIN domain-containing protein n=1 Tax=Mucilaginibacter sp. 10B2 TaxID=3048574 RepID=UPI002B23B8E7|nr:PIN domain-containing protein [Mucilaginibacter sp. 10B2]MEB0279895.1 PIN domain-containing protein [Mucilaginibacter sp. 10B2]
MSSCLNISKVKPISGGVYLFDTNVWLVILDGYYQKNYNKAYLDFFKTLINNVFSKNPEILMPSLLISEIVNRLIRDVYFKDFKIKNFHLPEIESSKAFKDIYRKDKQFNTDYKIIFQNIKAYQSRIKLIDDNFGGYRLKDVLKDNSTNLDFNDYIYCKLAKKHNATIITNDIDFSGLSIDILTANKKLFTSP